MKSRFKASSGVYVIAEVGINHNGSIETAKELIQQAAEGGANGVKIQVRHLESLYTKEVLESSTKAEQGTQYLLSELKRAHLTFDQVIELREFSKQFDIDFFATPFDMTSAKFLNQIGMELFKIGSPDMTNLPLLELVSSFQKPMILSTGMSEESEIRQVVEFLHSRNADFALLHCNSTYPASPDTINLRFMKAMEKFSGVRVGYSGHETGYAPTLAAVALGASIVERHITQDTALQGPDHRASLTPSDFKKMVHDIRDVEAALGEEKRIYSQGERNNRLSLAKSLVAAHDLAEGTVLTASDIVAKTPAKGTSPLELEKFIGKKLLKQLKQDAYLFSEHVNAEPLDGADYKINKTWGIVGRLNDFRDYLALKPDLIEIHMTWRDLLEYKRPVGQFTQDLVVHAPEYYQDKLIDFSSPDPKVTEYSLEMLQRTINIARDMAPQFRGHKNPQGPRVVVHPGGHFSENLTSDKTEQYRLLKKRLREIDSQGVRLLVENMPPRPWYFGGQWFNTIFMDPKEIAQFAADMKWKVCYDTSHAQLFCNLAGINLAEFTKNVLNDVAYLHISDAKGITEEGLQIGQGDIDFAQFFAMIKNVDLGFIPEIWQGHLHQGKGFKDALVSIEKLLKTVSGDSCSDPHH